MKKPGFILLLLGIAVLPASAQTLFTYGPYKAETRDFIRSFNKSNQSDVAGRKAAMKEHLELYINSRLRIQEAYDRGYDTLPQFRSDMENLRSQIIEPYLSDSSAIDGLRREAFARSQKDIHAAHIFISFTNTAGTEDTAAAKKKLQEVEDRLAKGEDFQELATRFSDDPSAKINRGDLHYVTVFTLPYSLENILYKLPVGKVSAPYRSRVGYHLVKNLGERKALGRIRIQQILLALPPDANDAVVNSTRLLADSLYNILQKGGDMASLAAQYSNDLVSAQASGRVPDITVGQYDAGFEDYIARLGNGELGKPVQTPHGFHIVRKTESVPVVSDSNDVSYREWLVQKIVNDERIKTTNDFIYARIKARPGLKWGSVKENALWAISDSLLDFRPAGIGRSITRETVLFSVGDEKSTVNDWIRYAQMNRYRTDRGGMKSYPELLDDFQKQAMYQYYRNHLEDYNDAFRIQMQEFREGNLFFEVMQQEVWHKAQTDTAALHSLYQKNKARYAWDKSAIALLFFCPDSSTAHQLASALRGNLSRWKEIVEPYRDRVVADSARFEWSQLPGMEGQTPVAGQATPFVYNPTDMTTSFAFVIRVHNQSEPRSFEEARGLVMNDYQAQLEDDWIKRLKKKYPVVVNQKALGELK